ncbi:hypothetical protein GUJ93_ZPchr0010g10572, partial [Zizania palustris]
MGGDADQLLTAGDQGSSGELDAGGSGRPIEVGEDLKSARRDQERHERTDGRDGMTVKSAKGRLVQVIRWLEGIESGRDLSFFLQSLLCFENTIHRPEAMNSVVLPKVQLQATRQGIICGEESDQEHFSEVKKELLFFI